MITTSTKFRGHGCFRRDWAGFEGIRPINVLIGRNNAGKSHLVDFVKALCETSNYQKGWQYRCAGILTEADLRMQFRESNEGGNLVGNHWRFNGRFLVDMPVTWTIDEQGQPKDITLLADFRKVSGHDLGPDGLNYIGNLAVAARHSLTGRAFRRLQAERDIRPEPALIGSDLQMDGAGCTNLIRGHIVTAGFRHDLIQREILTALRDIFSTDGRFTKIEIKQHVPGAQSAGTPTGAWEVFLEEDKKGLVPLSRSGSGLKTVILVLLNLLAVPEIEKKPKSNYVFAFEELENNLHPALLRRMLRFLEDYALREGAIIFLTTHSSVALDLFGLSENAQIIHVIHDGDSACAHRVNAHFDHLNVIAELGAKPSDLMQANGIIWVEGPSDCIYLTKWIDLFSQGQLKHGRDYQCAFYGGSLLARAQLASPEDAEANLVNLLRINHNIVVVCDGDRIATEGNGSQLKPRVQRIYDEVQKIPGAYIWITEPKEIECYIPGSILGTIYNIPNVPDPPKYGRFFPPDEAGKKGTSFVARHLKRKTIDKMDLALKAAAAMTQKNLEGRFDFAVQIGKVIESIKRWNS